MTRELKLALIVGFALVLVVTVLISDHLSHARQAELAGNVPTDPIRVTEPPAIATGDAPPAAEAPASTLTQNPGTGTPSFASQPPLTAGAMPSSSGAASPLGPTPETAGGLGLGNVVSPASSPMTINQGSSAGSSAPAPKASDDIAEAVRKVGGEIRDGSIFVNPGPAMQPVHEPLPEHTGPANSPASIPTPVPQPRTTTTLPPVVNPVAADQVYTVIAGDSMFKIAKKHYGDGKVWRKLAKYNKLDEDGQVRVGEKLNIPTSEVLLGKKAPTLVTNTTVMPRDNGKVLPLSNGFHPTVRLASGPSPVAAPSKTHTYTVKKGDTLAEIAQHELGSSKRAHEIVDLNKKTIKDPDTIPLGAVLTLPAA